MNWDWLTAEENRTKVKSAAIALICAGLAGGLTMMYRSRPKAPAPRPATAAPLSPLTANPSAPARPTTKYVAPPPSGAAVPSPTPAHALGQTLPQTSLKTQASVGSGNTLPSKAQEPVPATPPPAEQPFYSTYRYEGDRYRDPFIPLTGTTFVDNSANRPPNIATLVLKGIIQDMKGGRIALLTSGSQSYLLRGGRLYDSRNKAVPGIAGVVKTSSVVLIGSNNRQSTEIKIKDALP